MPDVFENDDDGYLRWVHEHPAGFVLNVLRSRGSQGLTLHGTSCSHITSERVRRAGWTTGAYVKVCDLDVDALHEWALAFTDSLPKLCRVCLAPRSSAGTVSTQIASTDRFVDVVAERGQDRLYAEAKGFTKAIGLDVDTLYGQLLRRMNRDDLDGVFYGVVVPIEARRAALRVPPQVRHLLGIVIFVVDHDGVVEPVVE